MNATKQAWNLWEQMLDFSFMRHLTTNTITKNLWEQMLGFTKIVLQSCIEIF